MTNKINNNKKQNKVVTKVDLVNSLANISVGDYYLDPSDGSMFKIIAILDGGTIKLIEKDVRTPAYMGINTFINMLGLGYIKIDPKTDVRFYLFGGNKL